MSEVEVSRPLSRLEFEAQESALRCRQTMLHMALGTLQSLPQWCRRERKRIVFVLDAYLLP